jgi:sarcosine oxidase subunit gamma
MVETAARRSVEFAPAPWLRARPAATRFIFRGAPAAQAAAGTAFGVALPSEACRAATNGSRAALWLGPDEYLLLAPDGEEAAIASAITREIGGQPYSLVDVSHRQVAFEVTGPHAQWLLEAQCPLPLDATAFPVGMCTRTIFAKAEVVLWRTAPETFHVEVWRSFSRYTVELLAEIARET